MGVVHLSLNSASRAVFLRIKSLIATCAVRKLLPERKSLKLKGLNGHPN